MCEQRLYLWDTIFCEPSMGLGRAGQASLTSLVRVQERKLRLGRVCSLPYARVVHIAPHFCLCLIHDVFCPSAVNAGSHK